MSQSDEHSPAKLADGSRSTPEAHSPSSDTPAIQIHKPRRSTRIQIRGMQNAERADVETLCEPWGDVQRVEFVGGVGDGDEGQLVQVTFREPEEATRAVTEITKNPKWGSGSIRAEYVGFNKGHRMVRPRMNGGGHFPPPHHQQHRPAEFPLRILVPGEFVGAIIGRRGATIKMITQESRARVDVHGRDSIGLSEKAITIFGNPDNCSAACKKILETMEQEASNNSKALTGEQLPPVEVVLKILAHNNLCGRLIGKNGSVIKKMMEETGTKVTVSRQELFSMSSSSMHDVSSYNMDRVITVKGTIPQMADAEQQISARLKQCFEQDINSYNSSNSMFPNFPTPPMTMHPGMYARQPAFNSPPVYNNFQPQQPPPEMVVLMIPNLAVGAIIGTKGSNIRNIIRLSNAQIKIAPLAEDEAAREMEGDRSPDRRVTITGNPEAQWKAQYYLFDKIKTEGFCGNDDARLQAEIMVPKHLVGRIIGKGGATVREMQRVSGAIIKLPEEEESQGDEVRVQITGHFFANQSAQRRIRALCQSGMNPHLQQGGPPHQQGPPMQNRGPPPQHHRGGPPPMPLDN